MSEELVRLDREGTIAILTLCDPDHRNAMSAAMGEAFSDRIAGLRAADAPRALVITGQGRAFSAGGDLGMIEARADRAQADADRARRPVRDAMRQFYGSFLTLRELECPTLAAVNGHAIGAGLCVALACDLRLAAREAQLSLNFTRLGLPPGMGGTWTLPRLVGPARAAELLYTSRAVDGEEAERLGLVSRALPAAEVLPAALELAREIAACAPLAVAATKRALRRSAGASLADQLAFEADEQARCLASDDLREGLAALRERRDPQFRGN